MITFIIPTFNSDKYIIKALDSIFKNFDNEFVKVIVIDDCSTDNSKIILEDYQQKNSLFNIQLIFLKENGGVGNARNIGLDLINTEYVGFLDSDDYFINGFYDNLKDLLLSSNFDIIEFGFIRFKNNKILNISKYKKLYNFKEWNKITQKEFYSKTVWYPSIRIYKSYLWSKLRFDTAFNYEDLRLLPIIFKNINLKIKFLDKPFLAYRSHELSITSNHNENDLMCFINYFNNLSYGDDLELIIKIRVARTIHYLALELNNKYYFNEVLKIHKILKSVNISTVYKYLDIKEKFFIKTFSIYNIILKLKLFLRRFFQY